MQIVGKFFTTASTFKATNKQMKEFIKFIGSMSLANNRVQEGDWTQEDGQEDSKEDSGSREREGSD